MDYNPNAPARIEWTRYWCPRDGESSLTEGGFLNKDLEYDVFSKAAVPLADLAEVPCLILLGIPGMGKTEELRAAHSRDGGPNLKVDLGRLDPAVPLREALSASDQVKQWAQTDAPTLWLDSLDEGVSETSRLAQLLGDELRKLRQVLPNLRLRITCRIANWPHSLERALKTLWPGDSCQVYQLLPLRAEDVGLAAIAQGVDFDRFLEAVRNVKAGPFATKPVTLLKMLLPEFKFSGQLAGTQVEVYEKGCKRLAAEWAEARLEMAASANHDAETRFHAAQFVAAAMTFYGRNVLDCSPDHGKVTNDAVHSREIGSVGGIDTGSVAVPSIAAVESVAKTALMSDAAGQHLYRFEHRTFQEYLAARFLVSQTHPLPKLLTLFSNPSSPDKRVVPQLIETAAWLAALDPKFRDALLQADPVAVLHSDVATQDDATQRKLFAALCDGLAKGEISESEVNGQRDLQGLRYNDIGGDIRAILDDPEQPQQVREFAIDVAWHAKVHEVYHHLAELALDTTRPMREREHCTYALAFAPDEPEAIGKTKARLAPLLDVSPADDPNDTLRGNALRALWRNLEADKLFTALRPAHNPDYIGAYWDVLGVIRRGLGDRHVLAGLAWIEKQPRAPALKRGMRQIMSRVLNLAWQNLNQPGVLEALAKAAAARLKFNEDVRLDDDGSEDHDRYNQGHAQEPSELASNDPKIVTRRRRICHALVQQLAGQNSVAFWLGYYMRLVQPEDFPWLLEQHVSATEDAERTVWLDLALRVWHGADEQVILARQMSAQHKSIGNAFREPIARLDPNSPESKAARQRFEQQEHELQNLRAQNTPEPLDPAPAHRIESLLSAFEGSEPVAWWQIWRLMRLND